MGEPQTIPIPADQPPDWSTTPDDFPCPLCSYNLRGLTTPRCPECGYAFTWSALVASKQSTHPYLFEHHRTPRTFVRTLAAGVLPRQFWRTLTAFHAVRPRRLGAYHFISLLLTLLPVLIATVAAFYQYRSVVSLNGIPFLFTLLAIYATWPWIMLLTLLIYRRSMWRASVRMGHLVRCVVYAWDAGAWAGLAATGMLAYAALAAQSFDPILDRANDILGFAAMAWPVFILVATYRLVVAYRHYLKMRRAWLAIPLAGVVVLLVYFNIFFFVGQLMSSR
jgi:hypothetical protein